MQNKIVMELHPKEANMIMLIRNRFQWGDLLIECKDALPNRAMKAHDWTMVPADFNEEIGKDKLHNNEI